MKYLSFGGGVNSTALMILLRQESIDFEAVFVNHGTDLPETYDYIQYLRSNHFEIIEIEPNYEGFSNLYEYCKFRKFLPSVFLRWCTYRFKLQPIWNYIEQPCKMLIGIAYDERHRLLRGYKQKQAKGIALEYPLIERRLTRADCVKIIKNEGLKVPVKSGCWLCPYQSKRQLMWLYVHHRNLFEKIVELERLRGNKHTLKEKPITHYVPYNNELLNYP